MADAAVLQQLAPTGKLRIAVAVAPSPSAQFAIKDGQEDHGRWCEQTFVRVDNSPGIVSRERWPSPVGT